MPPIPQQCQHFADELQELVMERADLQSELNHASPAQKPLFARKIAELTTTIQAKRSEYNQCIGMPPPLPPITCTLSGTATVRTSHPSAPNNVIPITLTLTFSGSTHQRVDVIFPTIALGTFIMTGPLGISCRDTVVISLPSGVAVGSYSSSFPFHLDIPMTLLVNHTFGGAFFCRGIPAPPSNLVLTSPGLTTRTVPSPLSATGTLFGSALNKTQGSSLGRIDLVGAGVLTGGYFNSVLCDVAISGTLSQPLP